LRKGVKDRPNLQKVFHRLPGVNLTLYSVENKTGSFQSFLRGGLLGERKKALSVKGVEGSQNRLRTYLAPPREPTV
jgi:hypothetical protein